MWNCGDDHSSFAEEAEGQEGNSLRQVRLSGYAMPHHAVR